LVIREPATRGMSGQWVTIRSMLTLLRAIAFGGP